MAEVAAAVDEVGTASQNPLLLQLVLRGTAIGSMEGQRCPQELHPQRACKRAMKRLRSGPATNASCSLRLQRSRPLARGGYLHAEMPDGLRRRAAAAPYLRINRECSGQNARGACKSGESRRALDPLGTPRSTLRMCGRGKQQREDHDHRAHERAAGRKGERHQNGHAR